MDAFSSYNEAKERELGLRQTKIEEKNNELEVLRELSGEKENQDDSNTEKNNELNDSTIENETNGFTKTNGVGDSTSNLNKQSKENSVLNRRGYHTQCLRDIKPGIRFYSTISKSGEKGTIVSKDKTSQNQIIKQPSIEDINHIFSYLKVLGDHLNDYKKKRESMSDVAKKEYLKNLQIKMEVK